MEKTVWIDGKEVRLKATAALPLRYKAQFGRDFFGDVYKMNPDMKKNRVENLDTTVFYNLIWVMAKNADKSIPEPVEWFDQFERFPLEDVLPTVFDLLNGVMGTKKKPPTYRQKRNQ